MIGRLVLSDRNIFKIKSGTKQVSGRKCLILSESHSEILIKTSKEFSTKDEYVKIDKHTNTIIEGLGFVGEYQDDLNIYYNLHTLGWMSNSKYSKLWDSINTNFDLTNTRDEYPNQVITIDPIGSIDLDDGFSFKWDTDYYYLDIHIADPVSFFDTNNPYMLTILQELLTRLQTCYIGLIKSKSTGNINKPIYPLYPTHLLPEKIVRLCSLLEINPSTDIKFRRAISFCFKLSIVTMELVDFQLKFTKLTNIKNYTYENYDQEINLESNLELKTNLVNLSNGLIVLMGVKLEPIDLNSDISLSHRMIEIFMILTNWQGGNYLVNNIGWTKTIIRTQDSIEFDENFDISQVPIYARPVLSHGANYSFGLSTESNTHYTLGVSNYAHLSSPMRRFIDMLNHLGFYQIDLEKIFPEFENIYNLEKINYKIKNYKKISNGYDLIKFIKTKSDCLSDNIEKNKFKACLFDWTLIQTSNKIKCMLVLNQPQYDFIKIVTVELPQTELTQELKKYMEFDVELYYNSNNFKSNKFPFSIKIL